MSYVYRDLPMFRGPSLYAMSTIGVPISALPPTQAVSNFDMFPLVQGGVTMRTNLQQILADTVRTDQPASLTGPLTITSGGIDVTGLAKFHSGMILDNQDAIDWFDSTGTARSVLWVDSNNNTHLQDASGGTIGIATLKGAPNGVAFEATDTTVGMSGGTGGGAMEVGATGAAMGMGGYSVVVGTTEILLTGPTSVTGVLTLSNPRPLQFTNYGPDYFAFRFDGAHVHAIVNTVDEGPLAFLSDVAGNITQGQADARYVLKSGDSISGTLNIGGALGVGGGFVASGAAAIGYPGVSFFKGPDGQNGHYYQLWLDGVSAAQVVVRAIPGWQGAGQTDIYLVSAFGPATMTWEEALDKIDALEKRLLAVEAMLR